jgi:hypothetical protein
MPLSAFSNSFSDLLNPQNDLPSLQIYKNVAFGADSLIEVTSAVGLLWRLYRARAGASAEEHSAAERKALVVAATFFALAVYSYESIPALPSARSRNVMMTETRTKRMIVS